jgi:hypothetical protein
MRIINGSYVGDGTSSKTITIGAQAAILISGVYFKTSAHPSNQSSLMASNSPNTTVAFTSITSTTFTVGSALNANGVTYYYTAIIDTGGGDIAVGTFTGNGLTRILTGFGFTPGLFVIKGNNSQYAWWRTTAIGGNNCLPFSNFALQPDRITSMDVDGVHLGSNTEINENTKAFYWFALKQVTGFLKVGSFAGNGVDDRDIAGLGMLPVVAWVKTNGATNAVRKTATMAGDAAALFGSNTLQSNLIQVLDTDRIQVGSSSSVNSNTITSYYVVMASGFDRLTKTIQMRAKAVQPAKFISMRGKALKAITKTIQMKGRCYNPFTPGRLRNLQIRSVDNQKFTKDLLENQPADALYTNLVTIATTMNLNYISTVALIDQTTLYPPGFTPKQAGVPRSAVAFNKVACDAIHAAGLGVIHRMTSMAMEGKANFPAWPSVPSLAIGTKTDIIPVVITDNFSRPTIGTSYVTNTVGGGVWKINNGKLVLLNAGNEFTYNIAHRIENHADVEIVATIEKSSFGHDGIIVHGSSKGSTPFFQGYGFHMGVSNTFSLEDIGARNIAADTRSILASSSAVPLVTGHYYKIRVKIVGTHIQARVWEVNDTEPSAWHIDIVNALYTFGWFGFTTDGFGKNVHFDDLTMTPGQNLNTFMGMVYSWIINNSNTFQDNDIIAPFPEFDTCQGSPNMCYFIANRSWLHTSPGAATVKFFNELKDIEDYAASQIGKRLKTGFTGPNFTSIQSITDPNKYPPGTNDLDVKDASGQTMIAKAGVISVDYYGSDFVSLYNPTGEKHPAQEVYDWFHYVSGKYHLPAFIQEWGGYSPVGSPQAYNANDVSGHDNYFRGVFNKMADLYDEGSLMGLNYYGFADTGDADTGMLRNGGSNYSAATLRVKGQVLKQFYQAGTPTRRDIMMRARNKVTPTTRTIQMRAKCALPSNTGRLKNLPIRGVDFMKNTKDTTKNQPSDASIVNYCEFAYRNLNLTHGALVFPIDPLSWYPSGYVPAPRPIIECYQKWVDELRKRHIKVLHRAVSFGMEGREGFLWRVGSNRFPAGNVAAVLSGADRNNWLGVMYDFIVNNPNLFADGDIWAPFPERTEGIFDQPSGIHSFLDPNTLPGSYAQFFQDVKTVSDAAFASIGKSLLTGHTADNYSEVRSQYIFQSRYTQAGIVPFDYYQNYNNDGYGKDALSEDIDAVYYGRSNLPLFWQEWGPTPDIIRAAHIAVNKPDGSEGNIADGNGVMHSLTFWGQTANPTGRANFIKDVLGLVADKFEQGIITGFNWWGFWDTGENDTGLIRITGSTTDINSFHLRDDGVILKDFLDDGITRTPTPEDAPPAPPEPPAPPVVSWTPDQRVPSSE